MKKPTRLEEWEIHKTFPALYYPFTFMQEQRTVLCCEWNNKGTRILKTCVWTVSTKHVYEQSVQNMCMNSQYKTQETKMIMS